MSNKNNSPQEIIDKARKLYSLAQRGIDGEKEVAEHKLSLHLKKHGLKRSDIMMPIVAPYTEYTGDKVDFRIQCPEWIIKEAYGNKPLEMAIKGIFFHIAMQVTSTFFHRGLKSYIDRDTYTELLIICPDHMENEVRDAIKKHCGMAISNSLISLIGYIKDHKLWALEKSNHGSNAMAASS